MKWVVRGTLSVLAIVAAVFGVGALLPVEHTASTSRLVGTELETVWTAVTDLEAMPNWRSGLDSIQRRPDRDGLPSWTEWSGSEGLSFEAIERVAPGVFASQIVGENLMFGGTWRIELEVSEGGTRVNITEDGEVYNPAARFISKFVIGHEATMGQYLDDLESYLATS